MLTTLHIRDFAVIDELELKFEPGMTVFTGETGAGKSIIVDALGLVLGDRADSAMLRGGAERCEISASFDIHAIPAAKDLLEGQAIPVEDDELLIRRILSTDGRSRAFINGSPVPVQALREIGEMLVDIHGQHAHQSLLKREAQRDLLDAYGDYAPELEQVAGLYREWRSVSAQLQQLGSVGEDREARLELLRYQVQELDALGPANGEFEALETEYARLANASRLLESTQAAYQQLSEDDAAIAVQLKRLERELQELIRYDAGLQPIIELLQAAGIQLNEAVDELRHYVERLDLDPDSLRTTEQRLSALHDMARKHRVQPEALPQHLESLREQLDNLESSDARHAALKADETRILKDYDTACERLHQARQQAATALATAVTDQIRELGMPAGEIRIEVTPESGTLPAATGRDRVEYLVTTNPGQPPRPLGKVASGGELSRISLAIQVIGSRDSGVPTLIFDEVDAGIGGGVAEIVGKLLRQLAGHRQVFCVTHLPQVASQGQQHLRVLKMTGDKETRTRVTTLSADERVEEIARMLGGLKITDQTRAHAREMLAG
jgi:DNA repair protein RecN (Recombination protein N)